VQTIITELAVIRMRDQRLWLDELMPGCTVEQVIANTEAELHVSESLTMHNGADPA
jgi:acyl CoA:acetate/3-ketoacid CoA transferase beta subunit